MPMRESWLSGKGDRLPILDSDTVSLAFETSDLGILIVFYLLP